MKERIKTKISFKDVLIHTTGVVLFIIGLACTCMSVFVYPLWESMKCLANYAFSFKWLFGFLLKWFLYSEGSAFVFLVGFILVQIHKTNN